MDGIEDKVRSSIVNLCTAIEREGNEVLLAIGFLTTDSVTEVGAKLLFEGDLPDDAEDYQLLSPVEWIRSEEDAFSALNQQLSSFILSNEDEQKYEERISMIFNVFASTMESVDLRARYGSGLYLTFAGVDPNRILGLEEKKFVQLMNTHSVFKRWCAEFD